MICNRNDQDAQIIDPDLPNPDLWGLTFGTQTTGLLLFTVRGPRARLSDDSA